MSEVKDVWTIDFPYPKQKEIYDFCNQFLDKVNVLTPGNYFDNSKTLHIILSDKIVDNDGRELTTIARYAHTSKYVEVDATRLRGLPKDQQMMLLCWCFCNGYARHDTTTCDLFTIEMLRLNGVPFKESVPSFISVLSTIAPELPFTQERIRNVIKYANIKQKTNKPRAMNTGTEKDVFSDIDEILKDLDKGLDKVIPTLERIEKKVEVNLKTLESMAEKTERILTFLKNKYK